jgi:hydrogenase 3 maturation protease
VLGVGNELNGDDAAGLLALHDLKQIGLPPDRFLLLETGSAPENFTAPIIRFAPDWVLALDAARLGFAPGQIAWIELDEIAGASAATHGLPLAMVGRYLTAETGCQLNILGMQVAQTGFDQPVSPEVSRAARRLGKALGQLLP